MTSRSVLPVPAWSLAFAAIAIVKLVMVADLEIIAVERPHDDLWHVLAAQAGIWGRSYSEYALAQLPGFAIVIALNFLLGFPLRIVLELAFITGAMSLSTSFGRLGLSRGLQWLMFTLIVFHPQATQIFSYTLAESWLGILTLFACAELIRLIDDPDARRHRLLFAISIAGMWFTRQESAPLIAVLFACIAIGLIAHVRIWRGGRAWSYAEALILTPMLVTAVSGAVLSGANGIRYGIWTASDIAAPNFMRAYTALQSIGGVAPVRYVPIPRQAREKAYEVSPTFAQLRDLLDGPVPNWGEEASRSMGIDRDIGAGWLRWSIRGAVAGIGQYRDARATEAYYGKVADELDAAFKSGALRRRHAILPFIDPAFATWLPNLPASLLKVTAALDPRRTAAQIDPPAPPSIVAAYDRVTHRRLFGAPTRISGWAQTSGCNFLSMQAVDRLTGTTMPASLELVSRPDVPAIAEATALSSTTGFILLVRNDRTDRIALKFSACGRDFTTAPMLSRPPDVTPFHRDNVQVTYAIDQVSIAAAAIPGGKVRAFVERWYHWVVSAIVLICIVLTLSRWQRVPFTRQQIAVLVIFGVIIGSRIALLAVLDASAWQGDQPRYLFPVAPLVVALPFILIGLPRSRRPVQ